MEAHRVFDGSLKEHAEEVTRIMEQEVDSNTFESAWEGIWTEDREPVSIGEKEGATFTNCFKNPFVYQLQVSLPLQKSALFAEQELEIMRSNLDDEAKEQEVKKVWDNRTLLMKQALYNFLQRHLEAGEFVEIYSVFGDHIHFDFGPPASESAINLEDALDAPEFMFGKDGRKLTIKKTQ